MSLAVAERRSSTAYSPLLVRRNVLLYGRRMQRIGIRELSRNTSQVLARVRGGETFKITDRGHPIARLVPVDDHRSALTRLVATGRAMAPAGGGPVLLPPEFGGEDVDSAAALAERRDEERW